MGRGKNKDGKETIEVIAVDYAAQVQMLEGEVKRLKLSLIEKERRHAEIDALLQVVFCFIAKKFNTIKNFKQMGGWRNIWMWAPAIPFLVDVIVELICIVRNNEKDACHENEKRAERLNKWCLNDTVGIGEDIAKGITTKDKEIAKRFEEGALKY